MPRQVVKFKSIKTGSLPISLGRNGEMQTSGVIIQQVGSEVWVQPMTSKGDAGRCTVSLPADANTLREMAAVMLMTAEELVEPKCEAAA